MDGRKEGRSVPPLTHFHFPFYIDRHCEGRLSKWGGERRWEIYASDGGTFFPPPFFHCLHPLNPTIFTTVCFVSSVSRIESFPSLPGWTIEKVSF